MKQKVSKIPKQDWKHQEQKTLGKHKKKIAAQPKENLVMDLKSFQRMGWVGWPWSIILGETKVSA